MWCIEYLYVGQMKVGKKKIDVDFEESLCKLTQTMSQNFLYGNSRNFANN